MCECCNKKKCPALVNTMPLIFGSSNADVAQAEIEFDASPVQAYTHCQKWATASQRSRMWNCRRRRLPSSWSNTKRRARVPYLQRRSLTKAHPRKVVLVAEGAKASSTGVVALHEGAEEVSRIVATSEEVRTSASPKHTFLLLMYDQICSHVLNVDTRPCAAWHLDI